MLHFTISKRPLSSSYLVVVTFDLPHHFMIESKDKEKITTMLEGLFSEDMKPTKTRKQRILYYLFVKKEDRDDKVRRTTYFVASLLQNNDALIRKQWIVELYNHIHFFYFSPSV